HASTNTSNEFPRCPNCGNSSNQNSYSYLSPPWINFTPIPEPSLPSFPTNQITIGGGNTTILFWKVQVPSITFNVPNLTNIPGFFTSFTEYIFEWIGVQIGNGFLYLLQALYLAFAYIYYWILQALVGIVQALGIWAPPVIVGILVSIGIAVRLIIGILKDASIIGVLAG
ncbi:MAG: hypothetical protein ACP5L4_07145, partial [Thermoplasmata archaeon]